MGALLAVVAVAGCTGVLDPIPRADSRPQLPATYSKAMDYAHAVKSQYWSAMANQVRMSNLVGGGLIPLAAVASGLTLFGKTNSASYLGLAGAGIWSTALWFRSQPAQLAYLAGYEATHCALVAVAPFERFDPQKTNSEFATALGRIDGEIDAVELAAAALARSAPTNPDLPRAATLLEQARTARDQARSLAYTAAALPDTLVLAVDRIQGEVARALITGQPDLASLGTAIGGLGGAYSRFGQVPEAGVQPVVGEGKGRITATAKQENELLAAMGRLAASQVKLATAINMAAAGKPLDDLRSCGVDEAVLAAGLSVTPAAPFQLSTTGARQGFVVAGGRSPYVATFEPAATGLALRQIEPFGPAFVIERQAAAAAGTYPILIRDYGGRQLFVNVMVPGEAANGSRNGANQRDPDLAGLTTEQVKALQTALCMAPGEVDGVFGPRSRRALVEYQRVTQPAATPTDRLTLELRQTLLASPPTHRCPSATLVGALHGFGALVRGQAITLADERALYVQGQANVAYAESVIELQLCQDSPPAADSQPAADLLPAIRAALREKASAGRGDTPLVTDDAIRLTDAQGRPVEAAALPACP